MDTPKAQKKKANKRNKSLVLTERYKEISEHPDFAEYAQHLFQNGNAAKKRVVSKVKKAKKKVKRAIKSAA